MEKGNANDKKSGRPTKGTDKLTKSINLKLTASDYKMMQKKAAKVGLSATQYAREMTLNGGVKPRFTVEEIGLMRQISGIANNLNQLAKRANIAGFIDVYSEALGMVDYFKQLLDDR